MKLTSTHTPYTFSSLQPRRHAGQGVSFGSVLEPAYHLSSIEDSYTNHPTYDLLYESADTEPILNNFLESEDYTKASKVRDLKNHLKENDIGKSGFYLYALEPLDLPDNLEVLDLLLLGDRPESNDTQDAVDYLAMKETVRKDEIKLAKELGGVFIDDIDERYPDVDPNDGDVEEMQHA